MNGKTQEFIKGLTPQCGDLARHFLSAATAELQMMDEYKGCTVEICRGKADIYVQAGLYSIGRIFNRTLSKWEDSDKPKQVTWTLTSKHLEGKAFDIFLSGHDPFPKDDLMWIRLGKIGESLGLISFAVRHPEKGDWGHYEIA